MQINVNFVIDFSPEVKLFLTALLGGKADNPQPVAPTQTVSKEASKRKPTAPVATEQKEIEPMTTVGTSPTEVVMTNEGAVSVAEAQTSTYTLEQVRAEVVTPVVHSGDAVKKGKILALLAEFGVKTVPDLDPSNYAEFVNRAKKEIL